MKTLTTVLWLNEADALRLALEREGIAVFLPDQFAAQAYDALQIMAIAIEKSGSTTDRNKLRDQLTAVKDYDGVTGKFAFDAKRNPAMDVNVLVVKDGKFTELK